MLGRGIFGSREKPLPEEVAVYITEDDSGALVGVVAVPGRNRGHPPDGALPTGPGFSTRSVVLAINDGIMKAQALQAPLVIVDPYGVWNSDWGELLPH